MSENMTVERAIELLNERLEYWDRQLSGNRKQSADSHHADSSFYMYKDERRSIRGWIRMLGTRIEELRMASANDPNMLVGPGLLPLTTPEVGEDGMSVKACMKCGYEEVADEPVRCPWCGYFCRSSRLEYQLELAKINARRDAINSMTPNEALKLLRRGPAAWKEWCKRYESTPPLDGQDLRGEDLDEFDFSYTDFKGTNMSGMDLCNMKFWRASFKGANLSGTDLSGSNLQQANFEGAEMAGANLRGANIYEARFEDADLRECDFRDCTMMFPTQLGEVASSVSFCGADLRGANLSGANWDDMRLSGWRWSDTQDASALVQGVQFVDVICVKKIIEKMDFTDTNWSRANLSESEFVHCIFDGASFVNANMHKAKFTKCSFRDCNFSKTEIAHVEFDDCELRDAVM